jgi:hypothetical protein
MYTLDIGVYTRRGPGGDKVLARLFCIMGLLNFHCTDKNIIFTSFKALLDGLQLMINPCTINSESNALVVHSCSLYIYSLVSMV